MTEPSADLRVFLIKIGNTMINKQAGKEFGHKNPEAQCLEVASTWCKQNKQEIRRISRYADRFEGKKRANFKQVVDEFAEMLMSDTDVMHFLAFDQGAQQCGFGTVLITVPDAKLFAYLCRMLRELSS